MAKFDILSPFRKLFTVNLSIREIMAKKLHIVHDEKTIDVEQ